MFCNSISKASRLLSLLNHAVSKRNSILSKHSFKVNQLFSTSGVNLVNNRNLNLEKPQLSLVIDDLVEPNVFGNLSKRTTLNKEDFQNDMGDKKKEELTEYKPLGRRQSTKQYADMIKEFIKKRRIKEAIDVLEQRMLIEDRVKPESYIYSLLIGACGRVGYTKKAFKLFNDMKKRGLTVHAGAYTGLFNACANSPWKEDGLMRATKLRELIAEKGYEPNDSNYNAMIKAFGRAGDLLTAFSLVDEMIVKKFKINSDTMNFLFQACLSDSKSGFKYSLMVWRKMMMKKIKPDIYSFNLLLRSIRDCNIGSIGEFNEFLKQTIDNTKQLKPNLETNSLLDWGKLNFTTDVIELNNVNNDRTHDQCLSNQSERNTETLSIKSKLDVKENRPNLLAAVPNLGNIIALNEIRTAEDRLLLVGGVAGILEQMQLYQVEPDIKTFTQLLDCISPTKIAERNLLSIMKEYKIKPDIDFFNMLIKKRSMRFDHQSGKEVLQLISDAKLRPDLVTYGVLAIGCRNRKESRQLLSEMKNEGYRMNSEILGAMLQQACYRNDFGYVLEIMELCLKERINPNNKFLHHLLKFRQKCLKMITEKKYEDVSDGSYFKEGYKIFNKRYQTWKTQVISDSLETIHPWTQFRETTEVDAKNYKDTKAYFKPRHLSRYRQKTSTKVRY